jgi:hypothetical protein
MIRITVEIWPNGIETGVREIAHMNITNVSDRAPVSDYEVWASSERNPLSRQPAFVASGMVVSHRRKDSIWALVAKAAAWVAASAEK